MYNRAYSVVFSDKKR